MDNSIFPKLMKNFKSTELAKKLAYMKSAYFRSLIWRPKANRSIAKINHFVDTKKEGVILCEGFWDNVFQWLRVSMLRSALAEQYSSKLLGLYNESAKNEWVTTLRSLSLSAEECISERVDENYLNRSKIMLKPINNSNT